MFCTGNIVGVNSATGEIQIRSNILGLVTASNQTPPIFGSDTVGIQYTPKIGDPVLLENSDNHHTYIVGTYTPPINLQQNKAFFNLVLLPLLQDEMIIFNSSGACIKLSNDGSIHLMPGGSGQVHIHNLVVDNIQVGAGGI